MTDAVPPVKIEANIKPQLKFKGKLLIDYSLEQLKQIAQELSEQERKYIEAVQHSKFEKFSPKPVMNISFVRLMQEVNKLIKVKINA